MSDSANTPWYRNILPQSQAQEQPNTPVLGAVGPVENGTANYPNTTIGYPIAGVTNIPWPSSPPDPLRAAVEHAKELTTIMHVFRDELKAMITEVLDERDTRT